MEDLVNASPRGEFNRHLRERRLTYQVTRSGKAVFYPRLFAPGDGSELQWRVSAGLGSVYSTTTVHGSGGLAHNVALVDLDEGFRVMSRVEGVAPDSVRIGMRVRAVPGQDVDGEPTVLFVPIGGVSDGA
jgi:uncharacterized OB-fold protein